MHYAHVMFSNQSRHQYVCTSFNGSVIINICNVDWTTLRVNHLKKRIITLDLRQSYKKTTVTGVTSQLCMTDQSTSQNVIKLQNSPSVPEITVFSNGDPVSLAGGQLQPRQGPLAPLVNLVSATILEILGSNSSSPVALSFLNLYIPLSEQQVLGV